MKHSLQNRVNSKLFNSALRNLKNHSCSYYECWKDNIPKIVKCCFTCLPGSKENIVPSGSLRNILDLEHLHLLQDHPFLSRGKLRFIYRLTRVNLPIYKGENINDLDWFKTVLHCLWAAISYVISSCIGLVYSLLILLILTLLPQCVRKIVVHSGQLECMKSTLHYGAPVVFLPVYRSPLDYFLITITFFLTELPQPVIFKYRDENIALSWILRILGVKIYAFDYQSPESYQNLKQCLLDGSPIMFHLEESPVRQCKLNLINGDIMHFLIRSCKAELIGNILVVPMNINYDTPPVCNFHQDVLGESQRTSSSSLTEKIRSAYHCLMTQHGMCRITLCQPFSLSELTKSLSEKMGVNEIEYAVYPQQYASIMTDEEKLISDKVINHIIYDRCNTEVIMSTNIISFIFLHRHMDYFTLTDLVEQFGQMCDRIETTTQTGFSGYDLDVVVYALRLLSPYLTMMCMGDVRGEENNADNADKDRQQNREDSKWSEVNVDLLIESDGYVVKPKEGIDISEEFFYYSDLLNGRFVLDAIVGEAIVKLYDDKYASSGKAEEIFHYEIVNMSAKFCFLLQYEFPFSKPCRYLSDRINDIINNLTNSDVLVSCNTKHQDGLIDEERWARRYASTFDDDFDSDPYSDEPFELDAAPVASDYHNHYHSFYRDFEDNYLNKLASTDCSMYNLDRWDENTIEKVLRYSGIVEPYLQVYADNGAQLLNSFKNDLIIAEDDFIENSLPLFRDIVRVPYLRDTLKNSLKLFCKLGIISYSEQNGRKYLRLNESYLDENYFNGFVSELNRYRRPGGSNVTS